MENFIFPFKLGPEGEKVLERIIANKLNDLLDAMAVSANSKPMSPKEVQDHFGVSKPTIDKWVNMGMPKHKIGSKVTFYTDEVDEWMKSQPGD